MIKILICEDTISTAQRLAEEADKDDHEFVVLADDYNRNYIINNIQKIVKVEQPQYMIVDDLNGRWLKAINLAKRAKPDLVTILYTSNRDIIKKAKEKGIPAFRKYSSQELDNMFMYIIDNEDKRNKM